MITGRNCHSACTYNDHMVVFGGREATDTGKLFNSILLYSFKDKTWTQPEVKGKKPAPRVGHIA